jgi:hypothetical protein
MSASRNTLALVMNGYQCQGIKTRKEQAANLINDFNLDENLEIRNGGAARSLNVNSRNFFIMLEHDPVLDESRKRHARVTLIDRCYGMVPSTYPPDRFAGRS